MTTTVFKLTRDQAPVVDERLTPPRSPLPKGTRVYAYNGCTYGVIGDGVAVSLGAPDALPFFELPWDALEVDVEAYA